MWFYKNNPASSPVTIPHFGMVCCEPSKVLKTGVPLIWEYLPVRSVARLGVQMELVTKALANRVPLLARRSSCGVWLTFEP